jgi:hypothetical protein
VHVLVHRPLEILEPMPEGAPRSARLRRHLEVARQLSDAFEGAPGLGMVMLEIREPARGSAVFAAEDAREHVLLFFGHVALEIRTERHHGGREEGKRGRPEVAVDCRHLAGHRGEPRKLLAQGLVIGGDDVADDLTVAGILPIGLQIVALRVGLRVAGMAGNARPFDLPFDFAHHLCRTEALRLAGGLERPIPTATVVDLVSREDPGGQRIVGGDPADRGVEADVHAAAPPGDRCCRGFP